MQTTLSVTQQLMSLMLLLQVVLPEGMAAESVQSAAGLQVLSGELMVSERTVEQVWQ